MSNAIFPILPGLAWGATKTPVWRTLAEESASGLEERASYQSYPRYLLGLTYEVLRAGAEAELQTLIGFFNQRRGSFESFLWTDESDQAVTAQAFGTGDGTTTVFRLGRTLGGMYEPVSAVNGTPAIYKAGVLQTPGSDYTLDAYAAKVTFAAPPAAAAALTWTGAYYWRVRFERDENEFRQFLEDLWEARAVRLKTVKTV